MDHARVLRSPRRGRTFLLGAAVCAGAAVASLVGAPHDVRLLLLPVAAVALAVQWLLVRRNGIELVADGVVVRGSGARTTRVAWGDVVQVVVEPWLGGSRLRLHTLDAEVVTPSLARPDLDVVLAAWDASRG